MSAPSRVPIAGLNTGVPGLDEVLGGEGLPEYSFNLIAGPPGSGKTTLAQQIMFANATEERPAIFFTVLGEPALKMIRYMQQFSFFDPEKVEKVVRFVNLSEEALSQDLEKVLERIVKEVTESNAGIVVVDSFRTVIPTEGPSKPNNLELFVQRLALHLTSWQATTFLIGEYGKDETRDNPVFTVADSLLWLWQSVEGNSVIRRLQIAKMRGRSPKPGLHTFRISTDGIEVFPRMARAETAKECAPVDQGARVSMGVARLDEMMGGGFVPASSALIAGPAGSGKTVLATHFIAAGIARGEAAVVAIFEEHPEEYIRRAAALGFDLGKMVQDGKLKLVYLRLIDLSVDETLHRIQLAIDEVGAKRLVIDSLSGLEMALAPSFQQDYREGLYRMVGHLTCSGITVVMTCEVIESFTDMRFTPHAISFLTDVIIVQRYVELSGHLKRVLAIVKMRNSAHSDELRWYEIGSKGLEIGAPVSRYRGVITGIPESLERERVAHPGLNLQELLVLQALIAIGPASVDAIADRVPIDRSEVPAALARLQALHYAEEQVTPTGVAYHVGKTA
jgi:circadian clock protein KaiC